MRDPEAVTDDDLELVLELDFVVVTVGLAELVPVLDPVRVAVCD